MCTMASMPRSGRDPWAARPCTTTRPHAHPRWSVTSFNSVGSSTIAGVGPPPADECFGALAPVLLVDHCGDDHITGEPIAVASAAMVNAAASPAFVSSTPLSVPSPLGDVDEQAERIVVAVDPDHVEMAVQHQRPTCTEARGTAITLARPGSTSSTWTSSPASGGPCRHELADLRLTGCTRHEVGIHRVDGDQVAEQAQGVVHRPNIATQHGLTDSRTTDPPTTDPRTH